MILDIIEVIKLYPYLDELDFIISLDTSEPAKANNAQEVNELENFFKKRDYSVLGD